MQDENLRTTDADIVCLSVSGKIREEESVPIAMEPGRPVAAEPGTEELLCQKDEEISYLREQLKRFQAEFENFRRRKESALEEARGFASGRVIGALLPVLDNMERAVLVAETEKTPEGILEGLQMILRQMKDIFAGEGLKEIKTIGEYFDPHYHEAVATSEDLSFPDDLIVEEMQKGYIFRDRVLRPALVGVNRITKAPDEDQKQLA